MCVCVCVYVYVYGIYVYIWMRGWVGACLLVLSLSQSCGDVCVLVVCVLLVCVYVHEYLTVCGWCGCMYMCMCMCVGGVCV